MADLATLEARLTEAEDALHQLMTGARVVEVRRDDGTSARWSEAQAGELRRYIAYLRREIARAKGVRPRPPRLIFTD